MSIKRIDCRLDDELYRILRAEAKQSGVTMSEVIRTHLRRDVGISKNLFDLGYREGRTAGMAAVLKEHGRVLSGVSLAVPPTSSR